MSIQRDSSFSYQNDLSLLQRVLHTLVDNRPIFSEFDNDRMNRVYVPAEYFLVGSPKKHSNDTDAQSTTSGSLYNEYVCNSYNTSRSNSRHYKCSSKTISGFSHNGLCSSHSRPHRHDTAFGGLFQERARQHYGTCRGRKLGV